MGVWQTFEKRQDLHKRPQAPLLSNSMMSENSQRPFLPWAIVGEQNKETIMKSPEQIDSVFANTPSRTLRPSMSQTQSTHFYKTMSSPVGELKLVASDKGLTAILWENEDPNRVRLGAMKEDKHHPLLVEAERQLKDYFAGNLERFTVKLDFVGTDFQKKVWKALTTIPFGETRSYAQIAAQIGSPKAVRAVGAANGKNPISIIAPCHRVIGSNGKLTGFAGGLQAKAFLLGIESKNDLLKNC
jgi:methylated-DNA-[protein]-cysteine S-methyltransferase